MTSDATRSYWITVLRDWAEARLMPPQLDECNAVLTELHAEARELAEIRAARERQARNAARAGQRREPKSEKARKAMIALGYITE